MELRLGNTYRDGLLLVTEVYNEKNEKVLVQHFGFIDEATGEVKVEEGILNTAARLFWEKENISVEEQIEGQIKERLDKKISAEFVLDTLPEKTEEELKKELLLANEMEQRKNKVIEAISKLSNRTFVVEFPQEEVT